jgi:hypothetical protein
MSNIYAQPKPRFGSVMAMITLHSPRQAMLMEKLLIEAMKQYAGKPEETLLAKWHRETVYMQAKAKKGEWTGWEDDYPVEPRAPQIAEGNV